MAQRTRKIYCHSGFAYAAFAAGDRNNSAQARNFILISPRILASRSGLLRLAYRDADIHVNRLYPAQPAQYLLGGFFDLTRGIRARGGQLERNADGAIADRDVLDQTEGDDVTSEPWILNFLQGI